MIKAWSMPLKRGCNSFLAGGKGFTVVKFLALKKESRRHPENAILNYAFPNTNDRE
jgi:hypothetical protein